MAGREPDPLELEAAAVIAAYLGGTDHSRDGLEAAEGQHDFDIELPDGRRIALEVTSIADGEALSFYNALEDDTAWAAPELGADWSVSLPDPSGYAPVVRIKSCRGPIVSALTTLEEQGITELGPDVLDPWAGHGSAFPPAVDEVIGELISMRISFVRSTQKRHEPGMARVVFSTHGSTGSNPDRLNRLVADRATAKHKKLAAVGNAAERHLFVWLTATYPDAELAFSLLPPPAISPPIPSCVDVVWLATPSNGGPNRMWTLRPPEGWKVVDLSFLGTRYALPPELRFGP